MKVKFQIKTFIEALNTVYLTVDKQGNLDSRSVYVQAVKDKDDQKNKGTLYLFSTNFVNKSLAKIDAEVTEAGALPIDPNQLYVALSKRATDASAQIQVKDGKCSLKIGKSNFKLDSSFNVQLGVQLKNLAKQSGEGNQLELPAQQILDSFKRAKNCISNDVNNTNKIILRCVRFRADNESIIVESTDGYKAATVMLPNKSETTSTEEYLIPGDMTPILLNFCTKAAKLEKPVVTITKSGTELFVKSQDTIISTTMFSGKFPSINDLISKIKTSATIEVNTEEMKTNLSRILGFDTGFTGKGLVTLIVDKDQLSIKPSSNLDCEETIEYDLKDGEILKTPIKVSGKDLLAILTSSTNTTIFIKFTPLSGMHLIIEEEIEEQLTAKYVLTLAR